MTTPERNGTTSPWTCVCGHVNSGFASACYGGCGKDRDRTERDFVTHGKAPLSTRRDRDLERGPALCAHTDFECDCDCMCGRNYAVVDCLWPDCECGCDDECAGCALVKEATS